MGAEEVEGIHPYQEDGMMAAAHRLAVDHMVVLH